MNLAEWNKIKDDYLKDHLSRNLKQPERRVNALNAIERLLKENKPEVLNRESLENLGKEGVLEHIIKLKQKPLSSAEKSVVVGLFKFL